MARIDDYRNAAKLAADRLQRKPLAQIAAGSGYEAISDNTLQVRFLARSYRISYPDFHFVDAQFKEREVPIQEQVLILHYLAADHPQGPEGRWIAYREIPGAAFYTSAFMKRAVDPLKRTFGHLPQELVTCVQRLAGEPAAEGDAGFAFSVFPKVPMKIVFWRGDEEFPPEANILFDQSIARMLSPEDVAWMAGMVVYRLMGCYGELKSKS